MKYENTVAWLKEASDHLDEVGQTKYADAVDHAIRIIAELEPEEHEKFINKGLKDQEEETKQCKKCMRYSTEDSVYCSDCGAKF